MRITRTQWALLALVALLPAAAGAQQPDIQRRVYDERRRQLMEELQQTQQRLQEIRGQRVQLQARIENVIAQAMEQRAQALLMSNEQAALRQLDSMLTVAQDNLLAQRDRYAAIGEAVRRQTGAVIVVLLRADSSAQGQTIAGAELAVDNAPVATRTYTAAANNALALGAVDQLYRADVLPAPHSVRLQATVNGQSVSQNVDVSTQGETVTYVQFAVRNGQLVATTWTSRGTTPF